VIEGERIGLEWVDGLVRGAKECLDLSEPPKAGEFCHHCAYVSAASQF